MKESESEESVPPPVPREGKKYSVDSDGVHRLHEGSIIQTICPTPIRVIALRTDIDRKNWFVVVEGLNPEGKPTQRVISRGDLHKPDKVATILAAAGMLLYNDKAKELAEYLTKAEPDRIEVEVQHVGWLPGQLAFVTPAGIIGHVADDVNYIYAPEPHCPVARSMRASGSVQDWQEHVAVPLVASPAGVFGLCHSFAVPFIDFYSLEAGGYSYVGQSSRGKSTLAQAAASVYGCGEDPATAAGGSMVGNWNSTFNGLEATAAAHRSILLVLDEIKLARPDVLEDAIYLLLTGEGKRALNQAREVRETRRIRTAFLSTGEISVADALRAAGRPLFTGQLVRLPDIHIGDSVFPELDTEEARRRADQLKLACARYYGTAGPAFVEAMIYHISRDESWSKENIDREIEEKLAELCQGLSLNPAQMRVARRFATTAYVGEIATELGLLPYESGVATNAAKWAMDTWLASMETLSDGERGLREVAAFLKANPRRFQLLGDASGPPVSNQAGYRLIGHHNEGGPFNHYLIHTETFRREALRGSDYRAVRAALKERGLMRLDKDGRSPKITTADGARPRCIWIHADILEVADEGSDH